MRKVMVLEDEASIRSFIVINLRRAGYEVVEAETGEEALDKLHANPDTLVALLDVMLPGIDGFEVCRRIRATNPRFGIIMLTARSQEMDKVTGLMTGADDYVTKPYSFRELLARIRAVLRRNQNAQQQGSADDDVPLTCGDIVMRVGQHQVIVRGESVFFPLKEFELLEYLMQNKGRVLTRHQLIDRIWGADYVGDTKTLDVHVKRVRAKIEEEPSHPKYLSTVRGLGYKIDEPAD